MNIRRLIPLLIVVSVVVPLAVEPYRRSASEGDLEASEVAAKHAVPRRVKFVFTQNRVRGIIVLQSPGVWRETRPGYDATWRQVSDREEFIEMELVEDRAIKYRVYNDHIEHKAIGSEKYVRDGEGQWVQ